MRRFLVCIHDASPAFARETRLMISDLAPLVGRRLSFGVVPDWHGDWPLAEHPDYCRLLCDAADERLLHGRFHQRRHGSGPFTWLTGGSDEMNGLDRDATRRTVVHAQCAFTDAFGEPARGFLAPAWQQGHISPSNAKNIAPGVEYVAGYFALESCTGASVALATWTWDCGRWAWLGHVGHAAGGLLHAVTGGTPALAIHPRDIEHGHWPRILQVVRTLMDAGYEPVTPADLLQASDAEVGI